ncbi:hypothetical protein EV210_1233 [Anaerospora hongkongensis]|uniref:Cell wall binding repeat protein n=1 Tax=Anaerospora hongkongensis TaxID=244830 RepID=A0A4R1PLW1_9FIRM|nr:hypothetical protein [Anaerospora hongkongensis]TCL32183.1 hypothetical protein EV210_1233 [Anaerospora hongkongensis]
MLNKKLLIAVLGCAVMISTMQIALAEPAKPEIANKGYNIPYEDRQADYQLVIGTYPPNLLAGKQLAMSYMLTTKNDVQIKDIVIRRTVTNTETNNPETLALRLDTPTCWRVVADNIPEGRLDYTVSYTVVRAKTKTVTPVSSKFSLNVAQIGQTAGTASEEYSLADMETAQQLTAVEIAKLEAGQSITDIKADGFTAVKAEEHANSDQASKGQLNVNIDKDGNPKNAWSDANQQEEQSEKRTQTLKGLLLMATALAASKGAKGAAVALGAGLIATTVITNRRKAAALGTLSPAAIKAPASALFGEAAVKKNEEIAKRLEASRAKTPSEPVPQKEETPYVAPQSTKRKSENEESAYNTQSEIHSQVEETPQPSIADLKRQEEVILGTTYQPVWITSSISMVNGEYYYTDPGTSQTFHYSQVRGPVAVGNGQVLQDGHFYKVSRIGMMQIKPSQIS